MTEKSKSAAQLLEETKTKLAKLNERRTRVHTLLDSDGKRLEEAREEALREYNTSNLEELRKLYAERSAQDNCKVLEFMDAVETIERQLADVERQLAQ
jgi:flagellar motility protein MotE (MotC chaperone)